MRMPPTRIVQFDYSGDLLTQAPVDGDKVHTAYNNVKELEGSSEEVRKLFTLDFADGDLHAAAFLVSPIGTNFYGWLNRGTHPSVRDHRRSQILEHISSQLGKDCGMEKQIAAQTIGIRNAIRHMMTSKKDQQAKRILVERIQARKKRLKILRRTDHERFVWLLNELRIKYVSPREDYHRSSRNYRRRQAATLDMLTEKKQKFTELKDQFDKQRVEFDEYKRMVLADVDADMKELGLTEEDVEREIEKSIVRPEPDVELMTRLQRAIYEEKKIKRAKRWKYVRSQDDE